MGTLTPDEVGFFFQHGHTWGGKIESRRVISEDETLVGCTAFTLSNRRGISTIILEGDIKLKIGERIKIINWTAEDYETRIPIIVMNENGEFVFERRPDERPFSFSTRLSIFDPPTDFEISEYDPARWFTMSTQARKAFAAANCGIYTNYKTEGFMFGIWTPETIWGGISSWEADVSN